jgi:hypothetical protein
VDVTVEAGLGTFVPDEHREEPDCLFDSLITPARGDLCHPEWFNGSAAVGDFDGDGWVDLYVTRLDDRDVLYRNLGEGRFEDVAERVGIPVLRTTSAQFADVDGDGDLDLYLTTLVDTRQRLLINDGAGAFVDESATRGADLFDGAPQFGMNAAFGDYDRDGDLDLYVTEWRPTLEVHDAPYRSRLLQNRGPAAPGFFVDVTHDARVSFADVVGSGSGGPGVWTFAAGFVDLDEDGWLDLAITGDFETSRLFWNRGDGTFENGTVSAGVGTAENAMGSAFGDFDGDGDLDWFVTSIWNPPWRIAVPDSGNRLYENVGGRRFTDATDRVGVRLGGWGWGASFFDFDLDGDLDLTMTNGWFAEPFLVDPSRLWINDGEGRAMREVAREVGFDAPGQGRGVLPFDYDGDGDLDVLVTHNAAGPILFRTDVGEANAWLRVRALGTRSDTEAVGARITVREADGREQVRVVGAGARFNGQMDRAVTFGLGSRWAPLAEVLVRFPRDGAVARVQDVEVGREIVVVEP